MEIFLDRRAIRTIRASAQEAIDEGDTESCREDILEAFTEEQIEEAERRLDHGDMFEFLTDVLDEWSGEDVDELMDLLEVQLGELGLELKTEEKDGEGFEDEEEEVVDEPDDEVEVDADGDDELPSEDAEIDQEV